MMSIFKIQQQSFYGSCVGNNTEISPVFWFYIVYLFSMFTRHE